MIFLLFHSEDATVVIPIGCMAQSYSQYIRTENDSPYQTSAAIALAIETAEGTLIQIHLFILCASSSSSTLLFLAIIHCHNENNL